MGSHQLHEQGRTTADKRDAFNLQALAAKRAAEGTQYECHNSNGVDHCTRIHKLPSTDGERQRCPERLPDQAGENA